jgi:hypothetical protein
VARLRFGRPGEREAEVTVTAVGNSDEVAFDYVDLLEPSISVST